MQTYPDICIFHENWSEELSSGTEHMLASDGSWKSHIMYPKTSYTATFYHKGISRTVYNQLIQFWRFNRGKEILFNSPVLEADVTARFGERPVITEVMVDLLTVKVEILGTIDE